LQYALAAFLPVDELIPVNGMPLSFLIGRCTNRNIRSRHLLFLLWGFCKLSRN